MIFHQDQEALESAIANMAKLPGRVYKHLTDDEPQAGQDVMSTADLAIESLPVGQRRIFDTLQAQNMTTGDLALALKITKASANSNVRKLIAAGLVAQIGEAYGKGMVVIPVYGVIA